MGAHKELVVSLDIDYKILYLYKIMEDLDYKIEETRVYKGKLVNRLYAYDLIDFILKMESRGFTEKDLLPFFKEHEGFEELAGDGK